MDLPTSGAMADSARTHPGLPGEGRGGAGVGGRGWLLWSLPRRAVGYVLVVDALAVTAFAAAVVSSPLRLRHVVAFSALTACAWVSVEGSRHLGSPISRRDRPYKDLLTAWTLPAALLLPPVYAVVIPVPIYLAVQFRVTRLPWVKRVFNMASVGIAGYLAASVHAWLTGGGPDTAATLLRFPGGLGAVLVAALVSSATSAGLVAGVLRRVAPGTTWRAAFGGWDSVAVESGEVCLGILVALAVVTGPELVVLALPPMLLLQRTLLHAELLHAARTDAKTGLANPAHWRDIGEREVARAGRGRQPLAVLLADIDHFKEVNDTYGHLAGDRMLAAVAEAVQAAIRPRDLAGRFGGEEFVVLLADTQPTAAAGTAERIRKRVEELDCRAGPAGAPVRVTISLGVACLSPDLPDLPGLLDAADAALYAAKAAGRNRVSPPTSRGNRGEAAVPVA